MDYSPPSDKNKLTSPNWSVPTRFFVLVLVVTASVWLAVLVAPLLQAVGIAVLLALLLNPLVKWGMRRLRLRRSWATAIVFILFCAVLLGIPIGMGSLTINQIGDIGADLSAAATELQEWLLQPIQILGYRVEPTSLLTNFESLLNDTLATLPRGSLNLLSAITTNLLWILTVFVMLYYLLKDGPLLRPWLMERLPPNHREEVGVLLDRLEEIWGRFLRIQLLLFFVLAVLFVLGTLLVVWLFRSGLIRWSPLGFALLLLAVYTAVQQVDNLWLRPQYMGRHLQLHPAIVFISLIAGLTFGGLLGALVSVPAVASARIVGRYLYVKILALPSETSTQLSLVHESSPRNRDTTGSKGPGCFTEVLSKIGRMLVYGLVLLYILIVWIRTRLNAMYSRFWSRDQSQQQGTITDARS